MSKLKRVGAFYIMIASPKGAGNHQMSLVATLCANCKANIAYYTMFDSRTHTVTLLSVLATCKKRRPCISMGM